MNFMIERKIEVFLMQNSVVQWLEDTARRFPDKVAFVDERNTYTWSQVRKMALSVAMHIWDEIHAKKQPIAIYMEKSADMLIVYFGVAYSGNFYSPIATDMPLSRISKILDTLRPAMCISTRELRDSIGYGKTVSFLRSVLCYEDICDGSVDDEKARYFADSILDTDLLYVLFTSGSTGTPKGVAITHRSVIDYIDWVTDEFGIVAEDSFASQSPFFFDHSILDIYSCLKKGATLHILPEEMLHQAPRLLNYLVVNKVSTLSWVPSALSQLARSKAFGEAELPNTIKRVLFCGEVMHNKILNLWRNKLPDVTYVNLYGPTEITFACTYYVVDRPFADDEPLPIGGPMRNTEILVLDEQDNLVTETGQVGELCVRGSSLAVGYYNNPEKTAGAFVQNPLQSAYEEKIYRTGDLVKYNDRHELMYLSRKDFQIKHLGHRIELGEIETAVASLDGVSACCCLYNTKMSMIVLFLEGVRLTRSEVNERLADMLPHYMLPSKVVCMDKLPLNANGKIDRVKLKEDYIG